MSLTHFHRIVSSLLFVSLVAGSGRVYALERPETELKEIGIVTALGQQVDLGLSFTDGKGRSAPLREFLRPGIPIIITPVYYGCPRLCGLVLNGVISLLNELTLNLGRDFQLLSVSFDPTENPEMARKKSESVATQITRPGHDLSAWSFLVGPDSNIVPLMEQLGFRYKKDGEEYAHGSAIMILTPEGVISQYFTGVDYPAWDVRLALVEASQGKVGSAIDHLLLFCYKFDPTKGKYTLVAFNTLRAGVLLSVFLCAIVVFLYSRRTREAH